MGVAKIAAVGLMGYGIYRLMARTPPASRAAFAAGEANGTGFQQVRNAGPDAMATAMPQWDSVDQAIDESFPASDPPATH